MSKIIMKNNDLDYIKALDLFAQILRYPSQDYCLVIEQTALAFANMRDTHNVAQALVSFSEVVKTQPTITATEELYTYTFDLNPACALETGWHLFGESYDRGMYLVWMRQQLREYKVEEYSSNDLPDHISYAIRILARMDNDKAGQYSQLCLLPAIRRIVEGFKEKDQDNPYRALLRAFADFLIVKYCLTADSTITVPLQVLQEHEELFSLEGV